MNQDKKQVQMKTTLTTKVKQSQMQPLEVEPHSKLVEKEVKST